MKLCLLTVSVKLVWSSVNTWSSAATDTVIKSNIIETDNSWPTETVDAIAAPLSLSLSLKLSESLLQMNEVREEREMDGFLCE